METIINSWSFARSLQMSRPVRVAREAFTSNHAFKGMCIGIGMSDHICGEMELYVKPGINFTRALYSNQVSKLFD